MRRSAIVFDIDGVVVRGRPDNGSPWFSKLREDLGVDPDFLTTHFFNGPFVDALRGKGDIREILERLLQSSAKAESLIDYWFRHDSGVDRELLALVAEFKQSLGVDAFLATNQEALRATFLWENLGLRNQFDKMVYSADVGFCKPESAFFQAADIRLDAAKYGQVLFVDDQEKNVVAAREHGWDSLQYGCARGVAEFVRSRFRFHR